MPTIYYDKINANSVVFDNGKVTGELGENNTVNADIVDAVNISLSSIRLATGVYGGVNNIVVGGDSVILQGYCNRVEGKYSAILNGSHNTVTGNNSIVLNGDYNIVQGNENLVSGSSSVVNAQRTYTFGSGNMINHNDSHVLGNNIETVAERTLHVNSIAIQNIPTTKPRIPGIVWSDRGTLRIS